MKFAEPLESQRLSVLLEMAASREARIWKGNISKTTSNEDIHISPVQRDEAVRWLIDLHGSISLYPETLSLAISTLDRFLTIVKARPKYLGCITIACFFLATKTVEEDECVPSLKDLVRSSRCGCSPAEILRMERIILDKLNWDLHVATPLEFLHIFHAMVLLHKPRTAVGAFGARPSQHVSLLTRRLHRCLAEHALLRTKGSVLALAIVTLELEKCCPDWVALTIDLLQKAQIDSSQIIRCRELVAPFLSTSLTSSHPNTVYIYQPRCPSVVSCARGAPLAQHVGPCSPTPAFPARGKRRCLGPAQASPPYHDHPPRQLLRLFCKHSAKRKVEEMEVDEFYDGIKRLYNEDVVQESAAGEGHGLACSTVLVRQEGGGSPCPRLQPVTVT